MRRRPVVTILMLIVAVTLTLPLRAQQAPFTEVQVRNMVRVGLRDELGAKLIEQRGIDFAPAEDFLQNLKAACASEVFLKALRAAKPREPASATKPAQPSAGYCPARWAGTEPPRGDASD
jgi:hypothetical protein